MVHDTRFIRDWVWRCAVGELLGFGCAAGAAAVLLYTVGEPLGLGEKTIWLVGMVVGGGLEGASLGLFQWSVLRRRYVALRASAWVGATVTVAALAWLVGMSASLFLAPDTGAVGGPPPAEPPLAIMLVIFAAFGALAGAAFGLVQWTVLRHHAWPAARWIGANAGGWALGMPWTYLAAALPGPESGPLAILGLGAAGGMLAGLSLAAITALALVRLHPLADTGAAPTPPLRRRPA